VDVKISPAKKIHGDVEVPPDKSITHRVLIFSSLAEGRSVLRNLLDSDDTLRTFNILEKLAVRFDGDFSRLEVEPPPKFLEPEIPLFSGNSGTTARLMMGFLVPLDGLFILYGDESLSRRPMGRVTKPLRMMGAKIWGRENGERLPIAIKGTELCGIDYKQNVASAQVKSAILIAGLRAEGRTTVEEPFKSRDHTERLLKYMGADLKEDGRKVKISKSVLDPIDMYVPGDISSASFFITLGVLHKNSKLVLKNVGLNPTRTGYLEILKRMGAKIDMEIVEAEPEPYGRITVETSKLHGTIISGSDIPKAIDELPLLGIIGALAEGETIVKDAKELRVKESDRIKSTVENLRKLGVDIVERSDGFVVKGTGKIVGGEGKSYGDHRMAMLLAIAGKLSMEGVRIKDAECVKISFPNFFEILEGISMG